MYIPASGFAGPSRCLESQGHCTPSTYNGVSCRPMGTVVSPLKLKAQDVKVAFENVEWAILTHRRFLYLK